MKLLNKVIGLFLGTAMMLGMGFAITNNSMAIPVHAAGTTVSYSLSSTGWENQSQHDTLLISEHLTATASSGNNTGKFYTTDNSWRFYANESATLTITGDSSVSSLDSITLTFSTKDSGIVKYGNANVASGTATAVSGTSVAFNISQSSGSKGKVFFTAFSITYTPSSAPVETHSIIFNANGSDVTNMPSNLKNQTGVVSLADISEPSRVSYTFIGWSLTTDGEVVSSVTIINEDVNVYAIWEAIPVTTKYVLEPASGSNNSYAGNCDIEIDGIIWNLTGNSTMQPWRIGGKSLDAIDRELYSKTAITYEIDKITVTHGAASGITVNSWTLIVASDSEFVDVISTLTPTFVASDDTVINRPSGKSWKNAYYKFVYNVTVTGTSNKFLEFTSAEFHYDQVAIWSDSFLSTITCDDGITKPDKTKWGTMKTSFLALDSADQLALKTVSNSATARYDYIVGKYGEAEYEDFIDRNPPQIGNARAILPNIISENNSTVIIIVITLVSLTSIGAYLCIRKKREN